MIGISIVLFVFERGMETPSSESESDCIDDTGCEELMKDTYWDINYLQRMEADDAYEDAEEEQAENEDVPTARSIQRFIYKEENDDGEVINEYYTEPQSDSEGSESSSSEVESVSM